MEDQEAESPVEGADNPPAEADEPATVEDVATAAIVEGEIIAESVEDQWQTIHNDLQEIKDLLRSQQNSPAPVPPVSSLEPPEPPLQVEAPAPAAPKRRSPYSTRTR